MPMSSCKPPLEKQVQADCLKWLNKQENIWAWRRTIGRFKVKGRIIQVSMVGQSDIEGIVTVRLTADTPFQLCPYDDFGLHLEVEVKRPGNKPTRQQSAYLLAVQAAGGIGIWADSAEMLESKLREEFKDRGWDWP